MVIDRLYSDAVNLSKGVATAKERQNHHKKGSWGVCRTCYLSITSHDMKIALLDQSVCSKHLFNHLKSRVDTN